MIQTDHAEAILQNATPIYVTEERTLAPGDQFTAEYVQPDLIRTKTYRWVLVAIDAPVLTADGYRIP